ncbi:MAG: fatty acid desaturase [Hyphomonadaceae bacterium]
MTALADFRLPPRKSGLFAQTDWDVVSVLAACGHLAFVAWLVIGFSQRSLWLNLIAGCAYSYLMSWNINGVAHNFLHTPFFRWRPLNYAFSLLLSLAVGFSQTFYKTVHLRHHQGNSDRQDENGDTIDWLSIYRYGKNGQPEHVLGYVFKSFFRDGPGDIYNDLKARGKTFDALWGRIEICAFIALVIAGLIVEWKAVIFLIPFYYFGECLSNLNGYYEHYRGNPDEPIAWGVSSYEPIYNFLWFNNGHHAEHHFRPAVHWTRLPAFRRALAEEQKAKGVHVISTPHALGFLAPENFGARRCAGAESRA